MSSEETTALQRAVGFLARREHSQHELRWKLSGRDYPEEEIEAALQRLIDKGLQSDERFTHAYIESRYQRGHGPYKIAAELKQRGVDEILTNQMVNSEDFDWFEHALNVYQKKYAGKPIADYKDQARRARFLQQRGFSSEQIQHAIDLST
ncbi:MAG: recombination regulator RecX [Gammaproteobacteria bacterium]|nr:recombination regulator RecX [Gammaproteobacteria bacterium]